MCLNISRMLNLICFLQLSNSKAREFMIPDSNTGSNQNLPINVETKSDDIQALVDDAIDWAHNICYKMRTPEQLNRSDKAQFTPFALFPSPIPRKFYEQALAVQKQGSDRVKTIPKYKMFISKYITGQFYEIQAMSLLYFRISRDFDFLKMAYKDVIQSDRSVRMYMELLEEIKKEGIKQPLSILMQRSDYMITVSTDPQTSEPEYQLRQNYLVFPFKQAKMTVVNNELGIYGYILGNTETGTVLHYEQPGNMLRTKDMQKNEGGVSSGDGVLDSPFLY
uniref:Secreted protein n=1 Tax=Globodera pallida TaxID=36090 RepID=A0A183C357_GLOPA